MSIMAEIRKNRFISETTLHGFAHMRHSRSKVSFAFWFIVTLLAIIYAGFEVAHEIRHVSSDIEFRIINRIADVEEIQLPMMNLCYDSAMDLLDWGVVVEYFSNYNWTMEDFVQLISASTDFWNIRFLSRKLDWQLVNAVLNHTGIRAEDGDLNAITTNATEVVRSLFKNDVYCWVSADKNRIKWNQMEMNYVYLNQYACLMIKCQPKNRETLLDPIEISLIIDESTIDQAAIDMRKEFIDFIWRAYGESVVFNDHVTLMSQEFRSKILLTKDMANHFEVDALMSNKPTKQLVPCKKKICKSYFRESNDSADCSEYSYHIEYQRGLDCFEWVFDIYDSMRGVVYPSRYGILVHWENFHLTILDFKFPNSTQWLVREFRPLFVWNQTLSNIGGILSIWTGASILSVFHLVGMFFCRCCKNRQKVGAPQNNHNNENVI